MGAVTTAIIGIAGAGLSFAQARRLADANRDANRAAAEKMAELKKQANVNVMEELSISEDLYKQELENNLQVSADLINAAREGGGREVAATAGRIGALQTERAEQSRLSQQQELNTLEAIQAQEDADINQQLLAIDAAAMQDEAARDAQTRAAVAQQVQSGISSLGSALTSISANQPLNKLSKEDKALRKLYSKNKNILEAADISEIDFYKNPKLLDDLLNKPVMSEYDKMTQDILKNVDKKIKKNKGSYQDLMSRFNMQQKLSGNPVPNFSLLEDDFSLTTPSMTDFSLSRPSPFQQDTENIFAKYGLTLQRD